MTPIELRAARHALGMTQQDMADNLGVTRVYINRLENTHHPIPKPTEIAIKAILLLGHPDHWPVQVLTKS